MPDAVQDFSAFIKTPRDHAQGGPSPPTGAEMEPPLKPTAVADESPVGKLKSAARGGSGHGSSPMMILPPETDQDQDQISSAFEAAFISSSSAKTPRPSRPPIQRQASDTLSDQIFPVDCSTALKVFNVSEFLNEGAKAIVDDSFTKCFKSTPNEPWNWNLYLFPLWGVGIVIRNCLLFPIRLMLLLGGWVLFLISFFSVHVTLSKGPLKRNIERSLTELMCSIFVASWTGVVKYHGPRPSPGANKVYVANHTSMIDFIILQQMCGHAVIMQKHGGWVGWLQDTVLESIGKHFETLDNALLELGIFSLDYNFLGCIHFDRKSMKDRSVVRTRLREHVADPTKNPLLIFPEGTCVNNEYCVRFNKGAFDIGATVYPVAIKYNKIFVDAFWNSKKQSFTSHLLRLMTSWAVVCDVWYLEPQDRREDETPEDFAGRVQDMICQRAGLTKVPWDGMLKYYRPRPTLTDKRRKEFAKEVQEVMELGDAAEAELHHSTYDVEEEGEDYLEGNHTVDHAGDLPDATGVLPMPSQKVPMGRTRMYKQAPGVRRRVRMGAKQTASFYLAMG